MVALPPNLAFARDVLSERGPMSVEELALALREAGIVVSAIRLESLTEQYPATFACDDHGRLGVRTLRFESEGADGSASGWTAPPDSPEAPAWLLVPTQAPLVGSDLVVLAAGPTDSSDRAVDIAAIRVSDGHRVVLPAGGEQLSALAALVAATPGLAGFGLSRSEDGPFGPFVATLRQPLIDIRLLALLDDPSRPRATLAELCSDLGVAYGEDLVDQAAAAALCLEHLVKGIGPDDGSWRLARACLVAGGDELARLMAGVPLPANAVDCLRCAPDPLINPEAATPVRNARDSVRQVFSRLDELGFKPRRPQLETAHAIADVLDDGGRLAVEAPTGTGKSLAYLAAAAGRSEGSHRPVIVATATKVLQHQLRRDVAHLQRHALFSAPFRQLFGVANYICTREVANQLVDSDSDAGRDHWLALAVAVRSLSTSDIGVWDDVADSDLCRTRPAYRSGRELLRTDPASCERSDCAFVTSCPLLTRLDGIRERPGVISANHALIASWASLAQQGIRAPGDVLAAGACDLVLDEAHDLEDSLTAAWTATVSRNELLSLAGRLDGRHGIVRELRRVVWSGREPARREFAAAARELRRRSDALSEAVERYLHEYGGRRRTAVLRGGVVRTRPEYADAVEAARMVGECLEGIGALLADVERSLREGETGQTGPMRTAAIKAAGALRAIGNALDTLTAMRTLVDEHLWVYRLSGPPEEDGAANQIEDDASKDWTFERIPIDVGPYFARGIVGRAHSVTLTSATLMAGGSFDYLGSRLGITVVDGRVEPSVFEGRRVDSPFDYEAQSAVVLTNHLPVPVPTQEREFVEEFARDQVGFLSLTGGRALTLFAARSRMEAVAGLVRDREVELAARGVRLLVQGELGRTELAERFRQDPGTVAYGLRSYWQGFDAPGETLSYLVIEKPPYPHPDDPIVAARVQAIADRGGDPFLEYVVPKTSILMAQGFGRLIRSETDRGVALIADRRVQAPGTANRMLLATLPGPTEYHARDRDDAWRYAVRFVTGADPDLAAALTLGGDDIAAMLAELRLVPGEDPESKLREAARRLFGIEKLHDAQVEVMRAHLGGRDTFAILPTGYGKSLCFQLPALLRPEDRATVVVSPLVALIKDQLDDLRGRRGIRTVQGITATTPAAIRAEVLRDLAAGKIRLLYVSPERLVRDPILRVALEQQDLAALVVDEAHCVSAWGHDFRPEFRSVARSVSHLSRAPRMALTATAAPRVASDIESTLEFDAVARTRRPPDRANLGFRVIKVAGERDRARELLRVVTAMGRAPGIVYASRRSTTEEVAALLRRAGFSARHFHAGMIPEQREAVQDDFLAGTTQIMVATKAFGMGVNKPDIGWVVHNDPPESLDAYVQEAGRAARSAELSGECVLLYSESDLMRRRSYLVDRETQSRAETATALLQLLRTQPRRGGDVVFDNDDMAERLDIESDELNVMLAWLERVGAIEQRSDCSARGTIHIGLREPADRAERERFRTLSARLGLRPQVGRRIDLDVAAAELGEDPDQLEQALVSWSLDRIVTFTASQRYRRLDVRTGQLDETALRREVSRWKDWQREQLEALVGYLHSDVCRRAAILAYFGFLPASCGPAQEPCDNCGGLPAGHDLSATAVPDPEHLLDVDLIVLQAVAWSGGSWTYRYGEASLRAAVLGQETLGDRPLGAGVRRCPQFGALRYLRAGERRWNEAVANLIKLGLVIREDAQREGRNYSTLAATPQGLDRLGGWRG